MGTLSNAGLTRRSIVLNAAGAGLAAALDLPARANPCLGQMRLVAARINSVRLGRRCRALEHERTMSDMRWIGLAGGLLCAFITPADTYGAAETRGAVPNFSSGDFPWVPLSPEYAPPASGPG